MTLVPLVHAIWLSINIIKGVFFFGERLCREILELVLTYLILCLPRLRQRKSFISGPMFIETVTIMQKCMLKPRSALITKVWHFNV